MSILEHQPNGSQRTASAGARFGTPLEPHKVRFRCGLRILFTGSTPRRGVQPIKFATAHEMVFFNLVVVYALDFGKLPSLVFDDG
jgi:hypothetical protein